ncbi:serpentine type 7TM GPCR chemoreceptor srsx domain-containing protein [Ditylenchus destructor]|uniref:Serpentine type 7TM GPCR chemoreceptor srsx domain-containing protein n=1 Tax=Ditylenchus destructor TaxID=166010 RepID=A0AAD4R9B9_9BILA|nr:serpentine type 7TM GPCR chemoreceptor srsx domain-containing protein [Ditylenchus destructor]
MLGVETVLIIAFDRLLGVVIPNVYRLINKWIYIGTTMFAAMVYAGWGLYEIYKLAVAQPNRMVIPFIGEAEHDFLMIFFANIVMFNLINLLCYFAIWIILKMRKNLRDTSMKKIVKSLIMISLVVFFGWTVCSSVQLVISFVFHVPEIPFTFLSVYFGVTVHGSLSVNYLILYKFSKDYKKALRKQLNDLCWFVTRKHIVHDMSTTHVTEVKLSKFVTNVTNVAEMY